MGQDLLGCLTCTDVSVIPSMENVPLKGSYISHKSSLVSKHLGWFTPSLWSLEDIRIKNGADVNTSVEQLAHALRIAITSRPLWFLGCRFVSVQKEPGRGKPDFNLSLSC